MKSNSHIIDVFNHLTFNQILIHFVILDNEKLFYGDGHFHFYLISHPGARCAPDGRFKKRKERLEESNVDSIDDGRMMILLVGFPVAGALLFVWVDKAMSCSDSWIVCWSNCGILCYPSLFLVLLFLILLTFFVALLQLSPEIFVRLIPVERSKSPFHMV